MIKEIKRNRELINFMNSLIVQSTIEHAIFYNALGYGTSVIINDYSKKISFLCDNVIDMGCYDNIYLTKTANDFFNRDNYKVLINMEFWGAL